MKKEFLPYYVSRAVLSLLFSILVMGFTWKALLFAILFFAGFLLYLHSGWFSIDLRTPFAPLRRDLRGREIQRKALITAVIVGLVVHLAASPLSALTGLALSGGIALSVGIVAYFATQLALFASA